MCSYTYDLAWKMINKTSNVTVNNYTVNALNQVTASPGAWHGYDQNGNMTSSGLTGYGYDDENQLSVAAYVSGDWSNGWRTEFTYDGKMRLRRQADCASGCFGRTSRGEGKEEGCRRIAF